MNTQDFQIKNDAMRGAVAKVISSMPLPYEVSVKPYKTKRSNSQNRLYWMWMGEIANQAETRDGQKLAREEWHLGRGRGAGLRGR